MLMRKIKTQHRDYKKRMYHLNNNKMLIIVVLIIKMHRVITNSMMPIHRTSNITCCNNRIISNINKIQLNLNTTKIKTGNNNNKITTVAAVINNHSTMIHRVSQAAPNNSSQD